jgi:Fe-S oxidoreductase
MRRYGRRPKTYAREIYTNENVFLGTRYANAMINSCTLCGLCGQRCPLGLSMAPLVAQTRRSMVASEKMPPSAHDFALRDMAFANSEHFALLRPADAGEAQGDKPVEAQKDSSADAQKDRAGEAQGDRQGDKQGSNQEDMPVSRYLFYPGCQLAASAPEHVEEAYAYLRERLPRSCGLMLGCCGAPADWAGRDDLLDESNAAIFSAWERCGRPAFILACSSCKDVFARRLPQIATVSLWQMVAKLGVPEGAVFGDGRVLNVHDACSARHDERTHESIRAIARGLSYEIEELRYSRQDAKCCGFGGLVYYANREQQQDFSVDGAAESPDDLLVYCAMCKGLFTEQGKRCFHILDLLFAANPEEYALKRMSTLSKRRENRAALKRRLLERVWGERPGVAGTGERGATGADEQLGAAPSRVPGYAIAIPPEVQQKMEERLILQDDVEDALARGLTDAGEGFYHAQKDSLLINIRKQQVTYWVEYAVVGKTMEVRSVYSHRMEVIV